VKHVWRRYQQVGRQGMKHAHAGSEEERFGPTSAAEHLADEEGIVVDHETLRRWMSAEREEALPNEGSAGRPLASWCSWMG
jgi:hypothetical protein